MGLMLFAGIRPDPEHGEITKLLWEDVGGQHVHVRDEVSKTKSERLIVIRPRLRRLLKGKPRTGKVVPPQWRKAIQRIRRAAGIDGSEYQDAARHSFASHHLLAFGEDRTKEAMGLVNFPPPPSSSRIFSNKKIRHLLLLLSSFPRAAGARGPPRREPRARAGRAARMGGALSTGPGTSPT